MIPWIFSGAYRCTRSSAHTVRKQHLSALAAAQAVHGLWSKHLSATAAAQKVQGVGEALRTHPASHGAHVGDAIHFIEHQLPVCLPGLFKVDLAHLQHTRYCSTPDIAAHQILQHTRYCHQSAPRSTPPRILSAPPLTLSAPSLTICTSPHAPSAPIRLLSLHLLCTSSLPHPLLCTSSRPLRCSDPALHRLHPFFQPSLHCSHSPLTLLTLLLLSSQSVMMAITAASSR